MTSYTKSVQIDYSDLLEMTHLLLCVAQKAAKSQEKASRASSHPFHRCSSELCMQRMCDRQLIELLSFNVFSPAKRIADLKDQFAKNVWFESHSQLVKY